MSYLNGRKYFCDRCGATVFVKCCGEGETDGGYTRWNKFEPLPDGWKNTYDVGMLCPECSKQWNDVIDNFKRNGAAEAQ